MEVEIARIEASLREADMMPVLSATLESDVIRTGKYDYLPKETKVGLTLSGNVEGVGFAGYGRVRAATAMIEAAKGAVETVRSEAIRRAKALVTERSTYKRVLISNDQLVESSQQTLASFMRQYDVGRKSWVDVLNAQKELADARQSMELTKSSIVEISLRLAVMIGQMDKYAGLLP
jgi:adhesin transport system outer membrane protein